MFDSLPKTLPPIVGPNPFTGVDVRRIVYPKPKSQEEPESEETKESIPTVEASDEQSTDTESGVSYADVLPAHPPPKHSGGGNPFTGLGVAVVLQSPQNKESSQNKGVQEKKSKKAEPYDDRGLPNVPPPVRKRGGRSVGVHTFIPKIEAKEPKEKPQEQAVSKKKGGVVAPKPVLEPVVEKPELEEVERYTRIFFEHFSDAPTTWRHVGRISEYPLVRKNGRAADLAELWPSLKYLGFSEHREPNGMLSGLIGDSFSFHCGIGRATVEIRCPVQLDLHALHAVHQEALETLVSCAQKRRLHILGYGMQPINPPTKNLLNHIFHLHSLHSAVGDAWISSSVRALERVQVSTSRSEFIDSMNLGHLLEPVFIALFGNTPIHNGVDGYRCSQAQILQDDWDLESGRSSMIHSPYKSKKEYIEQLIERKFLLKRDAEGWLEACTGICWSELRETQNVEQLFFDHIACDWGPVIPLVEHGHLEWRAACQQPLDAQMAPSALVLGLMERSAEMYHFIDSFFPEPPEPFRFGLRMAELIQLQMEKVKDPWPSFVAWRKHCLDYGLAKEELFTGLIEGALQIAQDGLEARGMGEEQYLKPLWQRLEQRLNPAQQLRRVFARKGIEGLLGFCSLASG